MGKLVIIGINIKLLIIRRIAYLALLVTLPYTRYHINHIETLKVLFSLLKLGWYLEMSCKNLFGLLELIIMDFPLTQEL